MKNDLRSFYERYERGAAGAGHRVNVLVPVVVTVLAGLLSLGLVFLFTGCTSASDAADDDLRVAETALTTGETAQAQDVCDRLLHGSYGPQLSEEQLGMMAIIYMKLAEQAPAGEGDDATATATECFRRAMGLSGDSLGVFFSELPLDDQRHFVLLRRISLSIDHPVRLDEADIASDDAPQEGTAQADAGAEAMGEDFADDSDEGF